MSEDDSLKEFLRSRKINLDELDPNTEEDFDLDGIEAKRIERSRAENFPLSITDANKLDYSIATRGIIAIFDGCLDT